VEGLGFEELDAAGRVGAGARDGRGGAQGVEAGCEGVDAEWVLACFMLLVY
jgi:hypothetical protein